MAHRRIPHARRNSSSQKTPQPSLLKTNGRQTLRIWIHSITTFGVPCWKSIKITNLNPQTKSSCVWRWRRSGETCHKRALIRLSSRLEEDSEHAWKQMEGISNTCCANEHWRVREVCNNKRLFSEPTIKKCQIMWMTLRCLLYVWGVVLLNME